jgi:glucokinase
LAAIAVDLQSSRVTCAAVSKSGLILEKETIDINNLGGTEVSQLIQQRMKKIIVNFIDKPIQIKSAGIGVPGIYFSKTGEVWAPNIPGWQNYNLKKDMNNFLIEHKILVKIASKRTCDILGERWLGAAKKSRNAIFLSVGTGIGAGIMMDGKILHGFNDGAGAAGWMTFNPPFKEEYRTKGCLEFLASGKGLIDLLCKTIREKENYNGILKSEDKLTFQDIFKAYEMKDPAAREVIKTAIEVWGMAAANLINLFNPEILIFGGALFGPALRLVPEIKHEAGKWAHPLFFEKIKFLPSQLGENAGLLGAGHLALKKI